MQTRLLLLLVLLTACGPKPPVPVLKNPDGTVVEAPPVASPTDEQAGRDAALRASQLEANGDTAGAAAARDELSSKYPSTLAAAELYEARAQAAATQGRTQDAIAEYEKLLFFRPSFARINAAREAYARLLLEVGRYDDAANMLTALYKAGGTSAEQLRMGIPLAEALARAGNGKRAVELFVELRNHPATPADQRARLEQGAIDSVDSGMSFRDAEELWDDVGNDAAWAFMHPVLAFKLAKVYYHTRSFDRCEQMLGLVTQRFPTSAYAAPSQEFLGRLRSRFKVDANSVGVLLPLSGKFQQYGERSLRAIELAFQGSPYKLVVKDSKGESLDAANAVDELVLKHGVVAILGELFTGPALAAAQKAEELSVPIISLSHGDGIPETGAWVFRAALTVEAQARGLAEVAFKDLGISSFALLYPRSRYGVDFATAFWREVEQRRGAIRGAQSYEHDQTTFKEQVSKLVGRYYKSSRYDYHQAVRELRAKNLPGHRFNAALEKLEKGLPPIVDFDAIIIPDSPQNVGLIAPALAFEDIVLTRDPKMLERIKKATGNKELHPVMLMGGSTWNHPQILQSCDQYCENSVFVDGYYPDSVDPKVRAFVAAYKEKVGADPNLSDAQAFDAAGLLRQVLASNARDREGVRKALRSLAGYPGVTGVLKFDEEGEPAKRLFVLTIQNQQILLWEASKGPEG